MNERSSLTSIKWCDDTIVIDIDEVAFEEFKLIHSITNNLTAGRHRIIRILQINDT